MSSRWTFVQRTVCNTSKLFQPLEDVIRQVLLPAIVGRAISDSERNMIALPMRYGGLGIQNPVEIADREYFTSKKITEKLTDHIYAQHLDLTGLDRKWMGSVKSSMKLAKETFLKKVAQDIANTLPEKQKNALLGAQCKGASSWLAALPLKSIGFALNKRDFTDGICSRYGWKIRDMPSLCGCGKDNSYDHALSCPLGGYTSMRRNALRDTEAAIMREVCRDVKIEPGLLPVENPAILKPGTNITKGAKLDISGMGVWNSFERSYCDVRVTHHGAQSHMHKSLAQLHAENEREKNTLYADRIKQIEKSVFHALIFNTYGGMGKDCEAFNRRLAQLISEKRKVSFGSVMTHIRTRLRFALLRSVVTALRGVRGRKSGSGMKDLSNVNFDFVPEGEMYESF